MGNITRRLMKDREGTRSNGGRGGCQVGLVGPTLVLEGAPLRVLALLF